MNRRALLFSFVLASLGIAACGSSGASGTASTPGTAAPTTTVAPVRGEIVVLAAASLTGSFTAEAKAFEQANPGTKVTLS